MKKELFKVRGEKNTDWLIAFLDKPIWGKFLFWYIMKCEESCLEWSYIIQNIIILFKNGFGRQVTKMQELSTEITGILNQKKYIYSENKRSFRNNNKTKNL